MSNKYTLPLDICVLGTGWLGLPLAIYLNKKSRSLICSASDSDKLEKHQSLGLNSFMFSPLSSECGVFPVEAYKSSVIIVTYPPRISGALLDLLGKNEAEHELPPIILVSSTSVYPEKQGYYTEDMAENIVSAHSGIDLLALEDKWRLITNNNLCVVRLGGLIGPGRNPADFIDAAKPLKNSLNLVNMVHSNDVISAIYRILETQSFAQTYNVCCPLHPSRFEFYSRAVMKKYGNSLVPDNEPARNRVVSSEKIISDLKFRFEFENPLDAIEFL